MAKTERYMWLALAAAWVVGICLLLCLVIDRVVGLYFGLTWYWTLAVVLALRGPGLWPFMGEKISL